MLLCKDIWVTFPKPLVSLCVPAPLRWTKGAPKLCADGVFSFACATLCTKVGVILQEKRLALARVETIQLGGHRGKFCMEAHHDCMQHPKAKAQQLLLFIYLLLLLVWFACLSRRGVRVVASAHGDFRSILKNPKLNTLVGGKTTVTVGDGLAQKNGGNKVRSTNIAHNSVCLAVFIGVTCSLLTSITFRLPHLRQ